MGAPNSTKEKYVLWLIHRDQVFPRSSRYSQRTRLALECLSQESNLAVFVNTPWKDWNPRGEGYEERLMVAVPQGMKTHAINIGLPSTNISALQELVDHMSDSDPNFSNYQHLVGGV